MKPKSQCTKKEWDKYLKRCRELRKQKLKDPRFLEKERSMRAKYRANNIEKEREKERERKRRRRKLQPEQVNEYQRERYSNDPEAAIKQCARRHKREPNRIIRAAARLFAEGAITSEQLNQRINDALAFSEQAVARITDGICETERLGHRTSKAEHGNTSETDSDKS